MLDQLDLIDTEGMLKLFGVSRTTLWRMVGDGILPDPIRMGRNIKWFRSSVEKAVATMAANSEKNLLANRPKRNRYA